nr:pentatricopeptide repeat-containing protein At4g04790, mitochondrial-like [Tanacetum cinerariifolium]
MFLIDMEMVEEFYYICVKIKRDNPKSLSRLAYYEMLLWIKVGNEDKIVRYNNYLQIPMAAMDPPLMLVSLRWMPDPNSLLCLGAWWIDFCLVDCLEGCEIGGGIGDGADVGNVEGDDDVCEYEQCPSLACHNVVEVELAKTVGGDVVVNAIDGNVGVDRRKHTLHQIEIHRVLLADWDWVVWDLSGSNGSVLFRSESTYGVQSS